MLYNLHIRKYDDYYSAGSFLTNPTTEDTQTGNIGTETNNNQKLVKFSKAGFYVMSQATENVIGLNREQLIGSNSPPDPDYDKFFAFEKTALSEYDIPRRVTILRNTGDSQIDVDLLAPGDRSQRDYLYTDLVQKTRIQLFLRLNRNNQNAGMVIEDASPDPLVSLYRKNDPSQKFVNCHFLKPGTCIGLFLYTNENFLHVDAMQRVDPPTPGQSLTSNNKGTLNIDLSEYTHEYTEKIEFISSSTRLKHVQPSGSEKSDLVACLKKGDYYFFVFITYSANPGPSPNQPIVAKVVPLRDLACTLILNTESDVDRFWAGFQEKSTKKNKLGRFIVDLTNFKLTLHAELEDPDLVKQETLQFYRDGASDIFISFARDPSKADIEPRIYFRYSFQTTPPHTPCSITNCLLCLPGDKCVGCEPGFFVNPSQTCSPCSSQFSGCSKCLIGACFHSDAGNGWHLIETDGKKYSTVGCEKTGCPAHQTNFKGSCIDCPQNCEKCHERLNTDSEPSCFKCFTSSRMVVDPATRRCVPCASDEYVDPLTSLCKPCSPQCLTCVGGAETCTSCDNSGTLRYLYLSSCVEGCPSGTVQNPINGVCESCDPACAACEKEPKICKECAPGYEKIQVRNSVKCLQPCQKGYFRDSSTHECVQCPEGHFLSPTRFCQVECSLGEAWIPPNNCGRCPNACTQCLDTSLDCFENIEFFFYEADKEELSYDITLWANIYKVLNGTREPMDVSVLKKSKNLTDLFTIKIIVPGTEKTIEDIKINSTLVWNPAHQKMVLGGKIPKSLNLAQKFKIDIEQTRNSLSAMHNKQPWQFFVIKSHLLTQEYTKSPTPDENTLKRVQNSAKVSSTAADSTSHFFNYGSLIAGIINIDQSGLMLKMAQTTKLISRLRLMGVDFGAYLQEFMDFASPTFERPSDFTREEFEKRSPQRYGKFSEKRVCLSLLEKRFRLPIFLYLGFSCLKWVLWLVLSLMEKLEKMNGTFLNIFSKVKRIHFSLFNMVALDLAFFGLRSLTHAKGDGLAWDHFLAAVCIFEGILDWFSVIISLLDFGEEKKKEVEKRGKEDGNRHSLALGRGIDDSLELHLSVSSMLGRGMNLMQRRKEKSELDSLAIFVYFY